MSDSTMTYSSTFAPPPTNNSDDGSKSTAFIVVGVIFFVGLMFIISKVFRNKFKDNLKSGTFEVDLESGLYGREGDTVHDYDRILSSSKFDANYFGKSKKPKFGADEGHIEFSSEGLIKFNLEDESSSEDSKGHMQFSSEDESSSEEEDCEGHREFRSIDKTIRNKQSKQVKYVKDTPKYNVLNRDIGSGYFTRDFQDEKTRQFTMNNLKRGLLEREEFYSS
ncbi:hypothetical protein POM88_039099 [Heracleum sosnowskyi]|uniref:Uncharacterized protein n=1 Tax=Heracleum sosnowskyi TaxID=360622 RepID=A0AAD8HC48_9APIA|nr:hypothetical protein POM88_039099 [Heracleum sosnowskyi]